MRPVERTLCALVISGAHTIMRQKERELSDAEKRLDSFGGAPDEEETLRLRADVLRASKSFEESVDLAELALRHFGASRVRPAMFDRDDEAA